MEATNYTSIGPVLQLNKAGELAQKRMKAAKLCDGLYVTEPNKTQLVKFIIEYNGVKWVEHQAPAANVNPANMTKRMPAILASIEGGRLNELNDYHKELHRRIFTPEAPAIMELKKPERKKTAPLPEGAKKVSVLMFKGCTNEIIDKKVIINEVAPHVYTHTYKLKGYGERVKIIFKIDGVYFQGSDNGAHIMEREDFTEVCTKAYEHARKNVADGAAKCVQYFVEVQKRIYAATPEQVDTPEVSAPQYDATAEVATKIMAYLPEVCKWQDDGDRTNALILKFMQPANAHHGFNGSDFVELAGLIGFTIEKKWRDRITKYVHTFQAHRAISCPQQSGVYGDMYTRPRHDTITEIYTIADAFMRRLLWLLERWSENQPATPSETPRISTETAERVKYRVSRFGGYKIIVGDREQGKVIAVLMSVNGHNTIEINDESAHIATIGEKPLRIDKPIMQLSDAEVLELIYNHIAPPQSPETPKTAECTTETGTQATNPETMHPKPKLCVRRIKRTHMIRCLSRASKHRHRANLAANMAYSKTNIYPGVSPPRENVYLCAKTLWEKQRLRLRGRKKVVETRKYIYPLQE